MQCFTLIFTVGSGQWMSIQIDLDYHVMAPKVEISFHV